MNDSTSIRYEEVKNASDEIRSSSKNMDDLFAKFRQDMDAIYQDDVFYGVASDSLKEKFDTLKTKLDNYVKTVQDFSDTIEKARSETEATERDIQREAEDLAE